MKFPILPAVLFLYSIIFFQCNSGSPEAAKKSTAADQATQPQQNGPARPFDTADYNNRMHALSQGDTTNRWPVKAPYPLPGAFLPFKRIVAFYGNLYSTRMGILGELPKDSMLKKLSQEVKKWKDADSTTPVLPALHYIAVTAQANGGKQRLRLPFKKIDTIVQWAREIHALVFIDIQVGSSTVQEEIPEFEKYLMMDSVHLGIDPEFSMKNNERPGSVIGTFNSDDINYVIDFLANLVKKNNLPPKILIVHRFTQGMVTGYEKIKKVPEVQVVMDMDGWGDKPLKISSYQRYIFREPVQFTGFKLFYKNDIRANKQGFLQTDEILKLIPKPIYIQYQ
ncbi:MAG: hypothetical protein ABJA57_13505 [Ginsengibacter sp.]